MHFEATVTSERVVATFAPQVKDRTFVITGAGQSSIGSSMAWELAKASPAHIVIASRTSFKVDPVLSSIRKTNPSIRTTFVQVDLSDHDSIRCAAIEILHKTDFKIDVLINSAGNMALKEYTVDKQKIEMQFSVNHIGHFLLTNLLVPALSAGAKRPYRARVVNLSSAGYQISPVRFSDPNFSSGAAYDRWSAYGQAKTAQILFAHGLTARLGQLHGIIAFACHSGSNMDTELVSHLTADDYAEIGPLTKRNTGRDFAFSVGDEPRFKTFDQIGATPLIAALDPDLVAQAPAFLQNGRVVELNAEHADSIKNADMCWELSERLVGQEFRY